MRQVAERAGVSQVTVTNVLRGRTKSTSAATRDRVLRSVRELGYTPVSQPASQRHHVETKVVGINFDQVTLGEDYLAMHLYSGLSQAASCHGYDLLMMHRPLPHWAPDREEVQFLDRRSDGFIFVAPTGRRRVMEALIKQNIPVVVCCGSDVPDGAGWIVNDEMHNMRTALNYLTGRGHRRIAFLEKLDKDKNDPQRADYFDKAALETAGKIQTQRFGNEGSNDPWRVVPGDLDAIRAWGATAVICFNDALALALWKISEACGLRVPQDLSIIGVDDFPEAAVAGLTTVRNDFRTQGILALDTWVQLAKGADIRGQRHMVPGMLIERETVTTVAEG